MANDAVDRRDFIKLVGKASLLAAAFGGAGYFLSQNKYSAFTPPNKALSGKKTVSPDSIFPDVASVKSADHAAATLAAIGMIGGIERFISRGDIVTIKPNVGWDRTAAQAANTNPVLVRAVAQACLNAGAKKVVVTDVSCNEPRRCFMRSGIMEAVDGSGAEILLPEERHFIKTDLKGEVLGVWPVLRSFLECDKLINIPIVKHHGMSRATIGMKNLYGVLGGPRNRLHQKIDISIADLADFFRPTLIVIDTTRVLMRNGPVGGNLNDVEIHNTVIASVDQVAADSFSCRYLGCTPKDLEYIALAQNRGLGKSKDYVLAEKELA